MQKKYLPLPYPLLLLILVCCCAKTPVPNEKITIDVWYGHVQKFGHYGQPHKWVNILGTVSSVDSLSAVYAVINQQDTIVLSLGQDCCRLARRGDFNVDLPRAWLKVGDNRLLLAAETITGERAQQVVTLHVQSGQNWPLPFSIQWADVQNISDVAEIMDGKWMLTAQGVRTVEPYYDRILTFGDSTWTDYEVSTSVIFHDFTPPAPGPPTFNVSHAAIASRFPGHDADEHQPHRKWYPLGATAEFRLTAQLDSCRWRIFDGEHVYVEDKSAEKLRNIELEKSYGMKHRVETLADRQTRYSVKLWPIDQHEPEEWDLIAFEAPGHLPNGAALLIAHNTDVTFGDVSVIPIHSEHSTF